MLGLSPFKTILCEFLTELLPAALHETLTNACSTVLDNNYLCQKYLNILFFMLNGDVFFPVKSWPLDVRRIFWWMSSGFRSEMDSIKPNMGTREDRDSLTSFLTMKTRKETPGSTSMWTTTSCCFSTVFLTRSNACPRGPKPAREDQKPAREDQKNKKKGYLVATKKKRLL